MQFVLRHIGKTILFVIILMGIGIFTLNEEIQKKTHQNTMVSVSSKAEQTIEQFKILRSYYTKNVISKVKQSADMKASLNHKGVDKTVPLPATMIHDLSAILNGGKKGESKSLKLHLYSNYPFDIKERRERQLDSFQQDALKVLEANPDKPFSRTYLDDKGHEKVRIAMADKMLFQACVQCHNSHPLSSKKDWKIGDVRGVLEVEVPISTEVAANNRLRTEVLYFSLGIGVLVLLLLALLSTKMRDNRQRSAEVLRVAEDLSQGNLCSRVEESGNDEITLLGKAVNKTSESLAKIIKTIKNTSGNLSSSSAQMKNLSEELHTSSTSMGEQAQSVAAASEEMATNIQVISGSTSSMSEKTTEVLQVSRNVSENMGSVAAAIEQAQVNLSSISAASEEMNNTIREIAENTDRGRSVTGDAVESVNQATIQVNELSKASQDINKVIEVIVEIAEQTKNLALNATIEAARAGEFGKGFAVVANEVKELAKQTSEATEDIRTRIDTMQGSSESMVRDINNISGVVQEVEHMVGSIASAVEEQSITVQSNTTNTSQAAAGMLEVASNIADGSKQVGNIVTCIDEIAGGTSAMAGNTSEASTVTSEVAASMQQINHSLNGSIKMINTINSSANKVAELAGELDDLVDNFKVD